MKLNRNKLRKLIFEVLNENESSNQNIAISDALYKYFADTLGRKSVLSNGFGFRQNGNVDVIGKKILNGGKEALDGIRDETITYVFGFIHPSLISKPELEKAIQTIGRQYNVNIKIGRTSPGTRYTDGADGAVYTINRID